MSTENIKNNTQPEPNAGALALSKSYADFAERLKTRGFWEGNKICNDPVKCKQKRADMLALSNNYLASAYM